MDGNTKLLVDMERYERDGKSTDADVKSSQKKIFQCDLGTLWVES